MRDTIAAIATATGGGVGMVRLSGPQALAVAGRVFRPMNPAKSPETMPGYTGAFGRVCHGEQLLDEAVLFVYHAPHSYTGEDVAEFCCHGGEFVLSQVLAAVRGPPGRSRRVYPPRPDERPHDPDRSRKRH